MHFLRTIPLLFCYFCNTLYAQINCKNSQVNNYLPVKTDFETLLAERLTISQNRTYPNKEIKNAYIKSVNEELKSLNEMYSDNCLMQGDQITRYLDSILNRIVSANSMLQGTKYHLMTIRTLIPNAYSYGDGLILYNLDMIVKMKSEAEIAYVLCHELAHDILDHAFLGEIKRIEIFNSASYKHEIRYAVYSKYKKQYQLDLIQKKYKAVQMRRSRTDEIAADSLGLLFLNNAGYDPVQAITQMEHLDRSDELPFSTHLDLKSFFSFSTLKFKENWLHNQDSSINIGNSYSVYDLPDSLKTHPDCKVRKANIESLIRQKNLVLNEKTKSVGNYNFIKDLAMDEEIRLLIANEDYSKALFYLINLYLSDTACQYKKLQLVHSLIRIAEAKKNHSYTDFCDLPSSEFNLAYNELLIFLENVSSSVLRTFALELFRKTDPTYCPPFLYNYVSFLISNYDKDFITIKTQLKAMEKEKTINKELLKKLKAHYEIK
jgi:hypothetical protein